VLADLSASGAIRIVRAMNNIEAAVLDFLG
jgi:hypothetical protein